MKFVQHFFFVGWMLSLCSCSGLRGRAEGLFEKGAYREAVETYEAALAQDPNDDRVIAGLKSARRAFIDKRLIETRMARLGANPALALDILLELSQLEARWAFFPMGQVAGTQEEESGEALRHLHGQVKDLAAKERPLSGLYLLTHYEPIFSGSLKSSWRTVHKELQKTGKKQCKFLAKQEVPHQPFFSEFVRKVCRAWEENEGRNTALNSKRSLLYKRLQISLDMPGLPETFAGTLQSDLQKVFQESPWFDAEGSKVLKIGLKGFYRHRHTKESERRVHNYNVQEPYQALEYVTKTRQVPYTDTFAGKSVTRYRTESYQEQVSVTRYRSVPHFHPYYGVVHHQTLELLADGALIISGQEKALHVDGFSDREGFEHKEHMSAIGLYPQSADLVDPPKWLRTKSLSLASDLGVAAGQIWDALYCDPMTAEPSLVATGNSVHQCLRHRYSSPPAFADAWYSKFFGISVAQADELLKLEDL